MIPFWLRLGVGVVLTIVAGRMAARAVARGRPARAGEALLIVALVVANPTLWATAFSMLVAIVPLWRTPAVVGPAAAREPGVIQA